MFHRAFLIALFFPCLAAAMPPNIAILVEAEAEAQRECRAAEYGTPEREAACAKIAKPNGALYDAGRCPRILESSSDAYLAEWSMCAPGAISYSEALPLIDEVDRLDRACRSGPGDVVVAPGGVCDQRTIADASVTRAGWCNGRNDEFGYMAVWHVCEPTSFRYREFAVSRPHVSATLDATTANLTSNLLESGLTAELLMGSGQGQWRAGSVNVSCRRDAEPTLVIDVENEVVLLGEGEGVSGGMEVALGGKLSGTVFAEYFARRVGEVQTAGIEVINRDLVIGLLMDLYNEASSTIIIASDDNPIPARIHLRLPSSDSLRDAVANLAVACGG